MTPELIFGRAAEVLRSRPYVFLCTVGADGVANVRQVQPFTIGDDLDFWVGTSPRSRKVAEVVRTGTATIAVDDPDTVTAVSLRCQATLVDDLATRMAHWIEDVARPFFPGGPDGDDFVLIHLIPNRVELIDFANNITPDPYGLVPAVIERPHQAWQLVPAQRG